MTVATGWRLSTADAAWYNSPRMDPRIGREFAGHRIEAIIGHGGVSVVYLAEHLRLGRKVALKVLAPHLAGDDEFRERFIRESRMAAGLDHPNIVTVYDAGEDQGSLYISMRYVDGPDLAHLLRSEGALEAARALLILEQIASALDAAHTQGLVHRDVKPGNILVESNTLGYERAYLSDFGISKRLSTGGGLTRTGRFVGTVDYVAPEQITGEPVDGRTDVYSLACVLYQCLSGHVPFGGETEVATIYCHLHDEPPPLADLEGPEGLDAVFARSLAKAKEERYPTCGSLIQAAGSVVAGASSTPTVSRPRPSEHRVEPSRATTEVTIGRARPDAPGRRRVRGWTVLGVTAVAVAAGLVAAVLWLSRQNGSDERGGSPAASTPDAGREDRKLLFSWNDVYVQEAFEGAGKQAIMDATVAGDHILAVGHAAPPNANPSDPGDAAVWMSEDGQRWRVPGSSRIAAPGDQRMIAVVTFDDLLVAAGWDGADGAVWTSDDGGLTWESVPDTDLGGVGVQQLRDLVVVGSTLVAVGSTGTQGSEDAAVWVSPDGRTWERDDGSVFTGLGRQQMWAAREIGDEVIAVGFTTERGSYDGAVWILDDAGWSRVDPEQLETPGQQVMLDVAGGSRGLPIVAVGCDDLQGRCDTESATDGDAAVWVSASGTEWGRERSGLLGGVGSQTMRALDVFEGSFVAVGDSTSPNGDKDGTVWTSLDGRTWRRASVTSSNNSDLGGRGDQGIRALVVLAGRAVSLLALGVDGEGDQEDAQVWTGTNIP